ncbi:TIGR03545 family protein [Crateriforma conspicua]|uniref:TIGR03545 family protein n=1 Tax=Crateriforma conspicua TaxID=2527996 RepID=UPI001189A7F1|nr:TIGR03545 family protein [Crateriforma conspicua]QDV65291.1 hypothetical protein Mal65_44610 [Crateriforma conspicua]
MIRWQFVFTRLFIVVLILFLIRWGLGPVAKYVTVRGLETVTGAKVEIDHAQIGMFPPRVRYQDVRIADPRSDKSMRDAFRADTIDLVIDGNALLHRRFVASSGRITGITIGEARQTSGHFDQVEPETVDDSPSMMGQLLSGLTGKTQQFADDFTGDLETIRRGEQIRDQWQSDYNALMVRAENLEGQIRSIRDKARDLMSGDELYNKLRDTSELPRLLEQAMNVREELVQVRDQIDSMPSRVRTDWTALQQAKQMDMELIDSYVPGNLSESKNFGIDLIANSIRQEIQTVRDYFEGGKTIADYTVLAPESERSRGQYFDLRGDNPPPVTLVRQCEVSGLMRADGNSYEMTGVVTNITPDPQLLDEPTKARLQLDGPELVNVEIVRDRRGGNDLDMLTVHWPSARAKPIEMGSGDDVRLTVTGGDRELWVQISDDAGQLTGRVVSKQLGVNVGLDVDPSAAETALVSSMRQSLSEVDRIEVDANFTGTWNDLAFDVSSNLSNVLNRAVRDAISLQVAESKKELTQKVDAEYLKQTQGLNQWLATHQNEANELMRKADESIAEITNKIAEKTDRFADSIWNQIESRLR